MRATLSAGSRPAWTSLMPTSLATSAAVSRLSPVSIVTFRTPRSRSLLTASAASGRTASARAMKPQTWSFLPTTTTVRPPRASTFTFSCMAGVSCFLSSSRRCEPNHAGRPPDGALLLPRRSPFPGRRKAAAGGEAEAAAKESQQLRIAPAAGPARWSSAHPSSLPTDFPLLYDAFEVAAPRLRRRAPVIPAPGSRRAG